MLYIVGQAPSRLGDGRPFTGPSGRRLIELGGFNSYEYMAARVRLFNLLEHKAERLPDGRGDRFDYESAKKEARRLARSWLLFRPETHVLACGSKVFNCFTGRRGEMYKGLALKDHDSTSVLNIWLFPHPSGASTYWNDPENVALARRFLRKRLRIADMLIE
jgi:uracil-DNA glycosylase